MSSSHTAVVTRMGLFHMQVCVPLDWGDEQVLNLANNENPCGTEHGWVIRKESDESLGNDPERQPCEEREGFVHIMLDT